MKVKVIHWHAHVLQLWGSRVELDPHYSGPPASTPVISYPFWSLKIGGFTEGRKFHFHNLAVLWPPPPAKPPWGSHMFWITYKTINLLTRKLPSGTEPSHKLSAWAETFFWWTTSAIVTFRIFFLLQETHNVITIWPLYSSVELCVFSTDLAGLAFGWKQSSY